MKILNVVFPDNLYKKLGKIAESKFCSKSALIRGLIAEYELKEK